MSQEGGAKWPEDFWPALPKDGALGVNPFPTMKKLSLLTALVVASLLLPGVLPAQTDATPETEIAPIAPLVKARRVAVGMTRNQLKSAAGVPDAMLDANVWVYWDFQVREVPADRNHDALLVVFAGDRVKFFKFTSSQPVRAFIARQEAAAAAPTVVARK